MRKQQGFAGSSFQEAIAASPVGMALYLSRETLYQVHWHRETDPELLAQSQDGEVFSGSVWKWRASMEHGLTAESYVRDGRWGAYGDSQALLADLVVEGVQLDGGWVALADARL